MKTSTSRERPILLGGRWVRAILEGRKTQTRRPISRPAMLPETGILVGWRDRFGNLNAPLRCPFGAPGDRLWVRETWAYGWLDDRELREALESGEGPPILYRADWPEDGEEAPIEEYWRPSIHMPRHISRLTLEITEARPHRLQDMTDDDARAEGVADRREFADAWDETYKRHGKWAWNPWVWAIGFRVIGGPS